MPQNAANKTVVRLSNGQRRRFFLPNGRAVPATANVINRGDVDDFNIQVYSTPAARSSVFTFLFEDSPAGTFVLSINDGTQTYVTPAITYTNANSGADLQAAIIAALNTAIGATNYRFAMTSATAGRIAFVGSFANKPVVFNAFDSVESATVGVYALGTNGNLDVTQVVAGALPGSITPVAADEVDPDGYGGAISVGPRGNTAVAFGQESEAGTASRNLLGPYVDIVCTSGYGEIELGTAGTDSHLVRID